MTIPRNSKLWLKDHPGKLWIIEEIKALMMQCGITYSYSLKSSEEIHCLYIYEQTYTFGTSPSSCIGSPFYKADGKLIQLRDLFPAPVLMPGTKYKVQLYGDQDGFELAQKWGFSHGYKWNKGVPRIESTGIIVTRSYGIFFHESGKITYCSGDTTYTGETGIQLYLSQLLNTSNNGEQVKVQGPHQPEQRPTGSSSVRFQSRKCKVAAGQRYTGNQTGYRRSRTKVQRGEIKRTICIAKDTGRTYGTPGSQGGLNGTPQAERGAVLDGPYERLKQKHTTRNSEIDF